jgi:hypothetical protein
MPSKYSIYACFLSEKSPPRNSILSSKSIKRDLMPYLSVTSLPYNSPFLKFTNSKSITFMFANL